MRAFEFLYESVNPIDNAVQDLEIISQKLEKNPDLDKIVDPVLDSLEERLKKLEAKTKSVVQSSSVQESMKTDERIASLQANLESFKAKLGPNDPDVRAMEAEIDALKADVEEAESEQRAAGFNVATGLMDSEKKASEEKALAIATRLGKDKSWARQLLSALDVYEDKLLKKNFLELVAGNSAMKNLAAEPGVNSYELKTQVDPSISGIFDNKDGLKDMLKIPFAEGVGAGSGIGPGEALLAMLLPNAKRPPKGDIKIGPDIWEVKGASYKASGSPGQAWLDANPDIKGSLLKEIFLQEIKKAFKGRKPTFIFKDKKFSLEDVALAADFRSTTLKYLTAIFEKLDRSVSEDILDKIYEKYLPNFKQHPLSKSKYESFLADSLNAIYNGDLSTLRTVQAMACMYEYGLGKYNSPNFIIYNPSTGVVMFSKGIDSIADFVNDPKISTDTMTMGKKADKAAAGIFLQR
jgi:hypothetical protein